MRGWVTPQCSAASVCFQPLVRMMAMICYMSSVLDLEGEVGKDSRRILEIEAALIKCIFHTKPATPNDPNPPPIPFSNRPPETV